MGNQQISINRINYIKALYSMAPEMHFIVRHKSELVNKQGKGITSAITQFEAEDVSGNVRFIINVDEGGIANTAEKAARILIMAMFRERNMPFDGEKLSIFISQNNQDHEDRSTENLDDSEKPSSRNEAVNSKQTMGFGKQQSGLSIIQERNPRIEHLGKTFGNNMIGTVSTYKVYKSTRQLTRGECPECSGRLIMGRRNIPVYDAKGDFHSYYICNILICSKCHENIMTSTEWKNLEMRLSGSTNTLIAKPSNLQRVRKNNKYMYEPISEPIIYHGARSLREIPRTQIQDDYDPFSTMQAKSFLKEAGYSTSVSTERRRELLRRLVREHGKRQVADYLRTFINLHGKRRNYHNAVSIWQSDLNYIARL